MNKLHYKNGLLYAAVEIYAEDKRVVIDDVIIDTGAAHTIILTDYLEELDIPLLDDDELVRTSGYGGEQYSAIRKKISCIKVGSISLENTLVDFGEIDPYQRVNGLVGLDFLKTSKVIIDLDTLCIYKREAKE